MTLNEDFVSKSIEALYTVENNWKQNNSKLNIINDDEPIFLQLNFSKILSTKRTIKRFPLPHPYITENSDVCLFVPDLVRGRKVDHEMTVRHYKNLLEKRGVKGVTKIIPSRQVRVEYGQYEAKRSLCNMFDVFLIDNKISSFLIPKLGKAFNKSRKWPIPIHLKKKNLKDEIKSKLHKTSMAIDSYGRTKVLKVGHSAMPKEHIVENILHVASLIDGLLPGGWDNVRSIYVKSKKSPAIPVYISLKSSNEIPTPETSEPPPSEGVTDELTTLGRKVTVYPDGSVKIL